MSERSTTKSAYGILRQYVRGPTVCPFTMCAT
jgi:hypothetical protein